MALKPRVKKGARGYKPPTKKGKLAIQKKKAVGIPFRGSAGGGLNKQQELFCQLYVNGPKELFGNGVWCYVEAYHIKQIGNWYKNACASASRLLSNVKIIERIRELLESGGFSDENVTKQHLFLINQHSDFPTKMRAISDYYKLKGQYAPEKKEVKIEGLVDEIFEKL